MMEVNCEVIEDLLPLYVEDMASESSKRLVREHLEHCEVCKEKALAMQKKMDLPLQKDGGALKKIREGFYRKKRVTICITMCIMLVLGILIISNLNAPIRLSYEQVKEHIRVSDTPEGMVELWTDYPDSELEIEYSVDSDGNYAQITCYTSKWLQLFGGKDYFLRRTILLENPGRVGNGTPRKVYYSPQANGEAICIYRGEGLTERDHENYIELPRLVLNVYMLYAGILLLLGGIICLFVRKNKKLFGIAIRVTVVPMMYIVSSVLVLFDAEEVYNAAYYFTGILLVTVLLSVLGWWGIGLRERGRYGKIKPM